MEFGTHGLCWTCMSKKPKPPLPADSPGHSNRSKVDVLTAAIRSAMEKSCHHRVDDALNYQLDRFSHAGYGQHLIKQCLVLTLKRYSKDRQEKVFDTSKVVAIPYYHGVSHRLAKVAQEFGVHVVYAARRKLATLTPFTRQFKTHECPVNHRSLNFVNPCAMHVVYKIPLSCGASYIGQTSRCVNTRIGEHRNAVRTHNENYNIYTHVGMECPGCEPQYEAAEVLKKEVSDTMRLCLESYFIYKSANCVSDVTIAFTEIEKQFLSL
jgi:hypothetical protein